MKRVFVVFLALVLALSVGVSARGGDDYQFLLLEDASRRLLVLSPETGLEVLTDQYVLDYAYDPAAGLVYYTAMEEGHPVLCAIPPEGGAPRYLPIIEDEETLAARQQPVLSLLGAPNKTIDQLVQAAMGIIYANEGSYSSVNADDNGALSIGKVQWHGNRALRLLQTIVNADEEQARAILGDHLCDEIITADNWGSRTVDAVEKNAISALLKTEEGKAAQDALAATDITDYITYGINKGLESSLALVYFADLQNQWGSTGAYRQLLTITEEGPVTLDMLHQACLNYTQNYHARRNKVYNYCLSLGWEEFTVTLTPPKNITVSCTGTTAVISWDAVDNAASYTCRILTAQGGFVEACDPVETEVPTCTVTLEPGRTYFAEITAKAGTVRSESSLWQMFDVLPAPVIRQVAVTGSEATVSWDGVLYAASYTCRIVDQNGQAACPPVETRDTSCTVTLEAGKPYQAVVTASRTGSVSPESAPYGFTVTPPAQPVHSEAVVTRTGSRYRIEVTLHNVHAPCVLLAAGYQNGQLKAVWLEQRDTGTATLLLEGELDCIRLMVLDELSAMKPLCKEQVIPQEEFLTENP